LWQFSHADMSPRGPGEDAGPMTASETC